MTEIKLILEDMELKIVDNCNTKNGKKYKTLYKGSARDCINYLKHKGLVN